MTSEEGKEKFIIIAYGDMSRFRFDAEVIRGMIENGKRNAYKLKLIGMDKLIPLIYQKIESITFKDYLLARKKEEEGIFEILKFWNKSDMIDFMKEHDETLIINE